MVKSFLFIVLLVVVNLASAKLTTLEMSQHWQSSSAASSCGDNESHPGAVLFDASAESFRVTVICNCTGGFCASSNNDFYQHNKAVLVYLDKPIINCDGQLKAQSSC